MKNLIITFAICLTASVAWAAGGTITIYQNANGNLGSVTMANAAPRNINFVQGSTMTYVGGAIAKSATMTVTAGNLLVAGCWESTANCTETVTDTLGNTWTAIGAGVTGYDSGTSCANIFYAKNITGGADQIWCKDLTTSPGGVLGVAHEYHGASITAPFDVTSATAPVFPAANPITATATTSNANELMFSYLTSFNIPSGSGNGTQRVQYIPVSILSHPAQSSQDTVVAVAGGYQSSWTDVVEFDPSILMQAAFK